MSRTALNNKLILGVCLGDCIHVAGLTKFLRIARQFGYQTQFIGAAVSLPVIIEKIKNSPAKIIALSYRLTPKVGLSLIKQFIHSIRHERVIGRDYYLGCLPELAISTSKLDFFKKIFTGGEPMDEFYTIFQVESPNHTESPYPADLISRIKSKYPYPVIRAHFGLPSLDATFEGITEIAESKVLDIISIAPDQAAQEWFHHPDIIRKKPSGSGGVPIRTTEHLNTLYKRSQTGNYPLLRIYSGTQDLIKNAELFHSSLHNAWAAIPIFWYSQLDGRGPLPIKKAIQDHFSAISWYAVRNIPIEVNDPHQWGLRHATDQMVVADAYLSARIAKDLGVKWYIEQLMFNTPSGTSFNMDFARVLAMIDIVFPLIDENFTVFKETRTGLAYLSTDPTVAKGQIAASTLFQLSVQPDIVHVVSYSEASHAATPNDVISSCKIVNTLIQDGVNNLPNYSFDKAIIKRKNELLEQAQEILEAFELHGTHMGYENPYLSSECLSSAVRMGLFDAPQLKGFPGAKGEILTEIIDGKCVAVSSNGYEIDEERRIRDLNIVGQIYSEENLRKQVSLNDQL